MQLEANLEEELVIWPVEDILEVGQGDPVRTHGQLDQVRRVLVIDVVDHLDRSLQREGAGAEITFVSSAGAAIVIDHAHPFSAQHYNITARLIWKKARSPWTLSGMLCVSECSCNHRGGR